MLRKKIFRSWLNGSNCGSSDNGRSSVRSRGFAVSLSDILEFNKQYEAEEGERVKLQVTAGISKYCSRSTALMLTEPARKNNLQSDPMRSRQGWRPERRDGFGAVRH